MASFDSIMQREPHFKMALNAIVTGYVRTVFICNDVSQLSGKKGLSVSVLKDNTEVFYLFFRINWQKIRD